MALIARISRMFKADLHAVLDQIEEPLVQLRQAVREMDEALLDNERKLALLEHERETLERQMTGSERALTALDEELDICFESDKTDLARSLVRRKLETERQHGSVRQRLEQLTRAIASSASAIDADRTRLENMRQKLALMTERDAMTEGSSDRYDADRAAAMSCSPNRVDDDDVEVAFLREQQRRRTT